MDRLTAQDLNELMGTKPAAPRVVQADYFQPDTGLTPEQLEERQQILDDMACLTAQLNAARAANMSLVYAVLRRETAVVKIGYSKFLTQRLMKMPGARLLAVTAGGRPEERSVHARLATSRVRMALPGGGITEHFHLTRDTITWINETRAGLGLEPVATLSRRVG